MPATSEATVVVFRGGFSADWRVVSLLLDLERRGARFILKPDGGFRVEPAQLLTPEEIRFLRAHRDEARRVLSYNADDDQHTQ